MSAAAAREAELEEVILTNRSECAPIPIREHPRSPGGQANPALAPGAGSPPEEDDVVDLTGSPDLEIVSSTVVPAPRVRKRPRLLDSGLSTKLWILEQAARAVVVEPRQPASPPGPKCGICMEPMGGSTGRPMWAGNCGHVYCKDCLNEAIRATRKCPTCRKNLHLRQLHPVFLSFS